MHEIKENLNGWWHAFFDAQAEWRLEIAHEKQTAHIPTGGWDALDEHRESVPVPGIWHDRHPAYHGVVWYQRPVVLPEDWEEGEVLLLIEKVRSLAQVYLDERLVMATREADGSFMARLGRLASQRLYSLSICVWHPDDTGGITGSVLLMKAE